MPRPSGISLTNASNAEVHFNLVEGESSFELIGEPRLERREDIPGASRAARTARHDILTWRHDDWSGGSGQRFFRSDAEESASMYHFGSLVDLTERGSLRNGWEFDLDTEIVSGAVNAPTFAHLAVADNQLFVFYTTGTTVTGQVRSSGGTFGGTFTVKASAELRGPVAVIGNTMWVGTSVGLYRVTSASAVTTWVSANECANPVVSTNRLYFTRAGTNKVELYQVPLEPSGSAPFTPTLVGTMTGVDKVVSTASDGDFVYILAGRPKEQLRLYRWDGVALAEFAAIPSDLIVDYSNIRTMEVRHGIVFIAGYNPTGANTANRNDDFILYFVTEQESGVVFRRPGRILGTPGQQTIDWRPTGMRFTEDDRLLIGVQRPNALSNTGEIWVYDLNQGSLYEWGRHDASTDGTLLSISDVLYWDGRYWTAAHYTDASTTNDHIDIFKNNRRLDVALFTSVWDFDLPDEEKILMSMTVQTDVLAASQYAEVWLFLDDNTLVSTDATGAANSLRHTSGTSTTFTLVDADSERTFKNLSMLIQTIPNSAGSDQQGVGLTSVTVRATTAGVEQFIRCRVDLSDEEPASRLGRSAQSGSKKGEALESILKDTSNRVVNLKAFYEKPGQPLPRRSDTYVCIPYSWGFSYPAPGQGECDLVLRVIG